MEPALRDGDWLLVDPDARPALNDLVIARDREQFVLKRVVEIDEGGRLTLAADNPAHAGQRIGPLDATKVIGRPWLRYWPLRRFGRIA
jgi:phage repressor protein C with HTH and peptisase S24 domain